MTALDSANSAPKFEIDPTSSVAEHGLIVRRPLCEGLEEFLGELAGCSGVEMVFSKKSVTELKRPDLLGHPAYEGVSRQTAEEEIRNGVPSLAEDLEVGVRGIGLVPFSDNTGGLILANFVEAGSAEIRKEQSGVHRSARHLVPGARTKFKKFKQVGVPIGKMAPDNTFEDREIVYCLGRHRLPGSLLLARAVFRPRVKTSEAHDPAPTE